MLFCNELLHIFSRQGLRASAFINWTICRSGEQIPKKRYALKKIDVHWVLAGLSSEVLHIAALGMCWHSAPTTKLLNMQRPYGILTEAAWHQFNFLSLLNFKVFICTECCLPIQLKVNSFNTQKEGKMICGIWVCTKYGLMWILYIEEIVKNYLGCYRITGNWLQLLCVTLQLQIRKHGKNFNKSGRICVLL